LRTFLLAVLIIGMAGTAAELLLIGHTEDTWQWAPLALCALCVVVLAWFAARRSAASLRALQAVMLLFIAAGVAGFVLHMQAKIEFQQEVNPSLAGMALYRKALESVSPPALAPSMMIQLGLLGLGFAYRHPALARNQDSTHSKGGSE
jgi:cation transport ATPase